MNKKAKFLGKSKPRFSPNVFLRYQYRGREYFVVDYRNGYSEPTWLQHKIEQQKIDEALDNKQNKSKAPDASEDAQVGLDALFEYFETGEWKA